MIKLYFVIKNFYTLDYQVTTELFWLPTTKYLPATSNLYIIKLV